MHSLQALLARLLPKPRNKILRVSSVQPLAAGVMVYAIDVDGRRIIVGASPRAICVLDRYPLPIARKTKIQRDRALPMPKSDNT